VAQQIFLVSVVSITLYFFALLLALKNNKPLHVEVCCAWNKDMQPTRNSYSWPNG